MGQTCAVTDGFGAIVGPGNVTTVQVTCVATTGSTASLRGAYRLSVGGSQVTKWLAFAADGTYIFTDIQYPPNPAAGCYGVDYGVYGMTATSVTILDALVYLPLANPPASCGFTDSQGNVAGTPAPFAVSGTGSNTTFSLTGGSGVFTGAAVPSVAGSIVGAWTFGVGLDQGLIIFGNDAHYLFISTQADPTMSTLSSTGVEYGCYTTSGVTGTGGTVNFDTTSACPGAVVTAGLGFSATGTGMSGSFTYATPDANTLNQIFGTYVYSYTRFAPD